MKNRAIQTGLLNIKQNPEQYLVQKSRITDYLGVSVKEVLREGE